MTRHIGERTLARLGQGDLSTRQSARIRAHLSGCARCRELNEDLAGVTTLLADVQAPPMPEHLSARIQTALAAEAARRAGVTAAAGVAGTETDGTQTDGAAAPTSRPSARAPRHERRHAHGQRQPRAFRLSSPVALRTMAAAAAAVVLAGGGYELVTHGGGSGASSSTPSGSSASGSTANNPARQAPFSTAAPQLRYEYAGRQYKVTAVASGTDYAPATLGAQVGQELKQNPASAPSRGGSSQLHSSSAPAAGSATIFAHVPVMMLQGCLARLAAGQQVLLVDVARYQGKSATVIVTRASARGLEQVWVVGTGCSGTRSDLLTHVSLAAAG
jgi:Putative zinc-finger